MGKHSKDGGTVLFDPSELVFHTTDDNTIQSAGFGINSILMQQGLPPMQTLNSTNQAGGGVSSLLNNLAVPAGLLYLQQIAGKSYVESRRDETVNEDLYSKLVKLVKSEPTKKNTRRRPRKKNRTTRKNT